MEQSKITQTWMDIFKKLKPDITEDIDNIEPIFGNYICNKCGFKTSTLHQCTLPVIKQESETQYELLLKLKASLDDAAKLTFSGTVKAHEKILSQITITRKNQ